MEDVLISLVLASQFPSNADKLLCRKHAFILKITLYSVPLLMSMAVTYYLQVNLYILEKFEINTSIIIFSERVCVVVAWPLVSYVTRP